MTAMSNITMSDYRAVSRFSILSKRMMMIRARAIGNNFGLAANRMDTIVRNLSGGNQQKVLLSKWRHHQPKILLVDEPTRGIDVGAKEEIMTTLRQLADHGLGILMVSSELEEVVDISDRVLVLSEGRLVAKLERRTQPFSVADILHAAFKVVATQ
jgi:ABC-type sugar transport system ATPase subunit